MSRPTIYDALLVFGLFSSGCTKDFDPALIERRRDADVGPACSGEEAACGEGACRGGQCCEGCWNGVTCRSGDTPGACGKRGAVCTACEAPLSACGPEGACVIERAVVSVGASSMHTCASDRLNTLWCWGDNRSGASGRTQEWVEVPTVVSAGDWIEVTAGGRDVAHTCAIHKAGSLWCWGDGSRGQLGFVPNAAEPSAVRVPTVVGNDAWLTLAAGDRFTCGVRNDATLWCWGSSDRGRNASEVDTTAPTLVGGAAGYTAVAAGEKHACAILNGALFCWGDDSAGQLGLTLRPADGVQRRPAAVASGTRYRRIAAGARHTCGIRDDSAAYCWGDNASGQLGNITPGAALEPTNVDGGHEFADIATGESHTCAVTVAGELYCWGDNTSGQLGLADLDATSVPTRIGKRTDWVRIITGYRHTCATTSDGRLWCWGDSASRQLGLGDTSPVRTPTTVSLVVVER